MAIESATHISDLVTTNPVGATDTKASLDDHIRLIKAVLKTDFANISGAVTPTHTELNYVDGVTSAIQDQIDALTDEKAPKASPTFTGTPLAPTAAAGTNTTQIATTQFTTTAIAAAAMSATTPVVASDAGKYWGNDGTNAAWTPFKVTRTARTANTVLGATDVGGFFDITSGTFSQTFSAAATLGSGWYCYIRNAGTGDVTLDPSGAETIDGLTSFVMYPGEARLIQCDGAALRSVVLSAFRKEFAASGNFIEPPGYAAYDVWIQAPGGGGGGGGRNDIGSGATVSGGAGGGAGAWAQVLFPATTAGTSHAITVGAAGAGGAGSASGLTAGSAGAAGGTSTFAAVLAVVGGTGGAGGSTSNAAGGAATTAGPGHSSGAGGAGGKADTTSPGTAGAAVFTLGASGGGGGGGSFADSTAHYAGGAGGTTLSDPATLAGGSAGTTGAGPGGAGNSPTSKRAGGSGGGGGGSTTSGTGGAGGAGGRGAGGGGGGAGAGGTLGGTNNPGGRGGDGGAGYFEIVGVV